jgi:hypothetical protein
MIIPFDSALTTGRRCLEQLEEYGKKQAVGRMDTTACWATVLLGETYIVRVETWVEIEGEGPARQALLVPVSVSTRRRVLGASDEQTLFELCKVYALVTGDAAHPPLRALLDWFETEETLPLGRAAWSERYVHMPRLLNEFPHEGGSDKLGT